MSTSVSAQQTLNMVSAALGGASVAANMGSDFAKGNLAQGLIDSLNLYLPAEALANANAQTNQTDVSAGLSDENLAINKAYAAYYANQNASNANGAAGLAAAIPAPTTGGGQTGTAATQYDFKINTAAFATDIGAITANGVPNLSNAISQLPAAAVPPGGYTTTTTFDSTTWKFTFATDPSDASGPSSNVDVNVQSASDNNQVAGQSTPNTTWATLWGIADDTLSFLNYNFGIGSAYGAEPGNTPGGAQVTSVTSGASGVTYLNSDGSKDIATGGSAAWRDNNPGNMVAGAGDYQPVGTNTQNHFAIFSDFQTGWNAMIANLQTPRYSNLSISGAISTWCPSSVTTNDPVTYSNNVQSWTGLNASTVLNTLSTTQLNAVGSAIMRQEGYVTGTITHIGQ